MPVKLLTSGGGGVTLTPSSSIASDVTVTVPSKAGTTVLTDIADNIGIAATGANYITMSTNGSERMRLDSSGNLLVGTTSSLTGHKFTASTDGGASKWGFGPYSSVPTQFYVSYNGNTGVYLVGGSTSWTANSDERLKTELTPFENATEKICSLRAGTGRYLTDEETVSRSFLIAQDVQAVLPEAVNVQPDEQGTLGLQYTDVIPLLVAAIKELKVELDATKAEVSVLKEQQSIIESLTERIAALEGGK